MSNFDINVDRWTEKRMPISHPAISRCDKNRVSVANLEGVQGGSVEPPTLIRVQIISFSWGILRKY